MTVVVDAPFEEADRRTRAALADQGFGVLTEIDVAATLKKKLGVEVAPQVILGACNPALAHRGLAVEPGLGLLLPCNVVVRVDDAGRTLVSVLDPDVMVGVTGRTELESVAAEATTRLRAALDTLVAGGAER
jgi:uncharacterized protein (DUF302 family)